MIAAVLVSAAAARFPYGTTARASVHAHAFAAMYDRIEKGRERVSAIYCGEDGEVFFNCGIVIATKSGRRCGVIRFDTAYRVWGQKRLACPKRSAPVA